MVVGSVNYEYQGGYESVPMLWNLAGKGQQFHRRVFRLYDAQGMLNTVKFQTGSVVFLHDRPEYGFELKPDLAFKCIGARAPNRLDYIKGQIIQLLKDKGCA